MRKLLVVLVGAALLAPAPAHAKLPPTRDILTVGNNWDGTADLVDPRRFKVLKRLNIVPDKRRSGWPRSSPTRSALGYFLGIRQLVGEGHDQLVDDAFTSLDGRLLYVSRPSFADVVAIRLKTGAIVWRTKVEGNRADHMAISPDGTRLLVSASTARKVHVLDTRTGTIVGSFESGDQPHENNYSADGTKIFHASIGTVFTPTDDPLLDATKGDRWFEIVDAQHAAGPAAARHGHEAGRGRLSGHELRRAADGARARASGSCTSRSRSSTASSSTTWSRTA